MLTKELLEQAASVSEQAINLAMEMFDKELPDKHVHISKFLDNYVIIFYKEELFDVGFGSKEYTFDEILEYEQDRK